MDGIRPKDYSMSYRRLVQHDFESEDPKNFENRKFSEKAGKADRHHGFTADHLTRINIAHSAIKNDGGNVLPVNFPAVGSILLEFMSALSEHMEWTDMIQEDMRFRKTFKGKFSDLELKHLGMTHIWGRLMSCIDKDSTEFDVDKVCAFTKSFFENLERSRYIFHAKEEKNSVPGAHVKTNN
jgi:hypothetical protein